MKNTRKNTGSDTLAVSDPRFDVYVARLLELIESGEAIESDKRAANAVLKRIENALAGDMVSFKHVDAVKRTARILQLSLD